MMYFGVMETCDLSEMTDLEFSGVLFTERVDGQLLMYWTIGARSFVLELDLELPRTS